MTVAVNGATTLFDRALADLAERPEQVGFFLADFDVASRTFALREWRPITPDGYAVQNNYHVSLTDEAAGDIIRWAWATDACLVEAHSHRHQPAEFSPSDIYGFSDWVPHLYWRLARRPYAALVIAGPTIDGLAWIEGADRPEPIERVQLTDRVVHFTGTTRLDDERGTTA